MPLVDPTAVRPVAVQVGQPLRFESDDLIPPNWFARVNGGAWTQLNLLPANVFVWVPTSVTNHLTFDRVDIASAPPLSTPSAAELRLDLCEGPPAVLWATAAIRNEAMQEPPLRPWDDEGDDPPLGTPFVMPGANRDRFGTVLLETVSEPGGPANMIALYGPGLFVDTAGKLGVRTAFTNDVRGLGPFPRVASYHHGGLYFNHDFGKSRTLGLTRVLYEDAGGHVAVVRGDGRRNTYRSLGGGSFEAAAGLRNTLGKSGGIFLETTPSGRVHRYDSGGKLDRVVDRYGTPAYYRYDANSRLQKIEGLTASALGLVPYLSYDGNGLLTRLVLEDPSAAANNRTTYFEYDATSRNLLKLVGPESCVTYFTYGGSDRLLASVTDPENYTWAAGYDGDERVERVVDALSPGKAAYFAYDTSVPRATWKDRAGRVTYFHFNAWGSPERVFTLDAAVPDYYTYDRTYGFLADSTNRLLRRWTYEVEPAGLNRLSVTDPLGARTYFAYDAQDLLRFHVDPLGRFTYLDYDGSRNRTRWIDPLGNTTYYEHEATGLQRDKKDRRGGFTYFAWDARANLKKVTDPLGNHTYLDYDAANERTAQVDPLGRVTYLAYDKRGRVTSQQDPTGATTSFAYDARCNLVSQTDARSNVTTHAYDGNSNRTRTVDPLGSATYLGYDPEERLASRKDARLAETTWSYDALGRRQKQVDALSFETYFAYDAAHQPERQVNARGFATYFDHDLAGRLAHRKDADLQVTYLGHDLAGQRVLSLDALDRPTYFEYDPRGWQRRTETAIGAVSYLAFDAEGARLRSVDPLGKTTYFTYDLAGRLTHTKDQREGVTYAGYDAANQTILRLDELGYPTYLTYDLAGRPLTTLDPAGLVTYHAYDAVGNVTQTCLEQGYGNQPYGSSPYGGERATTYHSYDLANRRQFTTDALGGLSYLAHDRVGNVDVSVDARQFATYFTYDALNRRTHTTDGVHFASTYLGYDPVGNVVAQVDPQGATSYLTYDRLDRLDFQHDPAGALTYYQHDVVGNRTEAHVLLGAGGERRSSYFEYDRVNRLIARTAPDTGRTYFEHDLAGNQVRIVDPVGRPTYMTYDELNRQATRYDAFLDTWSTEYDLRSSVTRQLDPEGRATYLGYDGARRLFHQSNALGERSYFWYDARSQRTHVLNPRGHSTYWRHDLLGRQTHRIDALGGVAYMGYDAVGNQVLAQDELLNATYFFFDGLNRVTRVMDATLKSTYMDYDSRSSLTKRVDADGRATYMAYDVAARLERQFFRNPVETADPDIYFAYDEVSNLTKDTTQSYYEYDKLDRTTKKVTLAGAVYYEYDRSGMKVAFKDADLSKNYYVYDAAGRLVREWLDDARTAYFEHDRSGLRTKKILPGDKVIAYYTYDAAGRVKQVDNFAPGFGSIAYFAYERNQLGKPTRIRHEGDENTYYEYDALDRLTLEQRNSSTAIMYGFRYAYDAATNRSNKSVFSSPSSEVYYAYDARNLLTREHVLSGDTSYYAFDSAQRMTSMKVTGTGQSAYFSHDQRGQATQIAFAKASSPDATRSFAYNAQGERVYVNDGTATYWQHDGSKLVLERLADGTPQRRYRRNKSATGCAEDMVEIVLPSGLRIYQANDPCGSPRTAVDHLEGVPQGQYVNDAFGNALVNESDVSGLAEVRARWQGASIARLNTSNMGLFLPPSGVLYMPKQGLQTFSGLGAVGRALGRVALAAGGMDCDWFCLVPDACPCIAAPLKCDIRLSWFRSPLTAAWGPLDNPPRRALAEGHRVGNGYAGAVFVAAEIVHEDDEDVSLCEIRQEVEQLYNNFGVEDSVTNPNDYSKATSGWPSRNLYYGGWWLVDAPGSAKWSRNPLAQPQVMGTYFFQARDYIAEAPSREVYWGHAFTVVWLDSRGEPAVFPATAWAAWTGKVAPFSLMPADQRGVTQIGANPSTQFDDVPIGPPANVVERAKDAWKDRGWEE